MISAELKKAFCKSFRLIFCVSFISFHKITSFFTFLVQCCINFEVISVRCSWQYKAEEGGDAGSIVD